MTLRLTVEAKPGKKVPSIAVRGGTIVVAVRERAIDGRANAAIERAIAAWLGVSARSVSIVRGTTGRRKFVDVAGIDAPLLAQRIAASTPDGDDD
jgi:uncharacterized protein YggU (UPF0235/DUF167 family)